MPSLDMATFERVSAKLGEIIDDLADELIAIDGRIHELDIEINSNADRFLKSASRLRHKYNLLRSHALHWRKVSLIEEERQLEAATNAVLAAQGALVADELQSAVEVLDNALVRQLAKRMASQKAWGFSILYFFSAEELELMELIDILRKAGEPAEAVS